MNCTIRYIEERDRLEVIEMMRAFYSSDAVFTSGSEEIFEADVSACISESPFIEGYILEHNGSIQGYAMLAKSFSTEFGKPCIWVEDIYVKEEYRGLGIGKRFLNYVREKYPDSLIHLEVEAENERAVSLYKKCGYEILPYMEMKR